MSMKIIPSKTSRSSDRVYSDSMYRREICGGTVGHSSPNHPEHISIPTNSIPLDARVQRSSLRTSMHWDYEKGEYVNEPVPLLHAAQHSVNTLKIRSVTSGRNQPEDKLMNVYRAHGAMASPVIRTSTRIKSVAKKAKKRK